MLYNQYLCLVLQSDLHAYLIMRRSGNALARCVKGVENIYLIRKLLYQHLNGELRVHS